MVLKVPPAAMWSVFFVILSYLDRNFVKGEFLSSEKESKELFYMLNNTLCARSSVAGQYHLHQVTDGVEEVRSVHDSQGRLVDCSVIRNEMQVKSFMHVCRIGLRDQKTNSDLKRSLTGVSEAKASCNKLKSKGDRNVIVTTQQPKEANSDGADHNKTLRRSKRGFTYPGTLWCGAGNIADHYDQLGEFAETDKCCRVHDYCPYVIHAFSSNYGYTNFKWHSLSHCDCDNALKECLRQVNDTSSRVVGQAFFNVIEVPCFEFSYEEQCVERHWYGVCKQYDKVPVAVIKESIPYDFGGIDVIDVLTIGSDKEKQDESQGAESTTQSTLSESKTTTPEEPSLTNVVTAAEDFIKVLATVSTSQSSSADVGKGETQSERKKKNSGKKKKENKKRRGKGKGRKKNQKLDAVLKVDEGTPSVPSTGQTEEVMGKNNLMEGHAKIETFRTKDNFMNRELDAVGNGPLSNKMMRDDPPRTVNESQEVVSTSASPKKEEEILEHTQGNNTESFTPTSHNAPAIRDTPIIPKLRHRSEKKKTRKTKSYPKEETLSASLAEGVSLPTSTTESPIMAVRKEMPHSTEHKEERGPVVATFTTQNTPIVRTKRPNSRQREGRKRMKKIFTPSTEEPSRDLTSGDSQGSDTRGVTVEEARVLERLGLDRIENLESFATSSSAPVGQTTKFEGLKGAIVRRKFEDEHSNPSRRVIKICYEVILPAETDTSALPADTAIQEDPEITTTPTYSPSTVTRTPRTTKMKRTKQRGTREKRGKVKTE